MQNVDIVFLDKNSESAVRHVTCLNETTSSVGLNVNFQNTNSDSNTLVVWQIEPVSDFQYLGSMVASIARRRS